MPQSYPDGWLSPAGAPQYSHRAAIADGQTAARNSRPKIYRFTTNAPPHQAAHRVLQPEFSAALYFPANSDIFNSSHSGGIAQLGERLDGIEKVRGSSPLASIGMKGRPRYEAPAFLFFPSGIHRPRPELPGFGSRFSCFSQIFPRNRGGRKTTDLSPTMGTGRVQLKPNWRISFKFHPNVDN